MPARVDIVTTVTGAPQAERQLRALGQAATTVTRQVNATQTGLSARREFMAGQRLQGTITGMLGLNNPLTQTIDGFERLGYMAESSGMKLGEFLKRVGPGAISTSAAVLTLTYAWSRLNNEFDRTNANLVKGGFNKQTDWQQMKGLFADITQSKIFKTLQSLNPLGAAVMLSGVLKPDAITEDPEAVAKRKRAESDESVRRYSERVAARERLRKGDEARLDPWFDFFGAMAKGGAKLPGADVYGSREYVANQQQIEEAPRQTQIAEATLAVLERMLTEIRAGNGTSNAGVFSWP